jgi:ribosomal protein S18 acetylase RimI-like enzyme
MDIEIRRMVIGDYERAYELWLASEGVGLIRADQRENIERFLKRNEGLSFVAVEGEKIVGTVLCGQDGRRGHLYHLAVRQEYKRRGIGKELVRRVIEALEKEGYDSCQIMVFAENKAAMKFWEKHGWQKYELVNFIHGDVLRQLEQYKGIKI